MKLLGSNWVKGSGRNMNIITKVTMKSTLSSKVAEKVAYAIAPDNLGGMGIKFLGDGVTIFFNTEKIRTLIATVDDLLMNAIIAEEVLEKVDKRVQR
jgi:hypothetical protein